MAENENKSHEGEDEEIIRLGTAEFEAVKVRDKIPEIPPEIPPQRLTSQDFLEEVKLSDDIISDIASVLGDEDDENFQKPPPIPPETRKKAPDMFVLKESDSKFHGKNLRDSRRPSVHVSYDKTRYFNNIIAHNHTDVLPHELQYFIRFLQKLRFVAVRINLEWIEKGLTDFNLQFAILPASKYTSGFIDVLRSIAAENPYINLQIIYDRDMEGVNREFEELYELEIDIGKKRGIRKGRLKQIMEIISALSQTADLEDIAWMYEIDEEDQQSD